MDKLQTLNQELVDVSCSFTDLHKTLQPLLAKQEKLFAYKKALMEEIDTLKYQHISDGATNGLPLTQEEIDLILIGDSRSTPEYRAAQKVVENKLSLRRSGYYSDTMQTCFEIKLYKNNPEITKKTCDDIKLLLPHLKPITFEHLRVSYKFRDSLTDYQSDNVGVKFSIFEHTLSEFGIYSLLITPYNHYLIFTRHSNSEIQKVFSTLEEALTYIQNNHWYEKTFGKYDSDDNDYESNEDGY